MNSISWRERNRFIILMCVHANTNVQVSFSSNERDVDSRIKVIL